MSSSRIVREIFERKPVNEMVHRQFALGNPLVEAEKHSLVAQKHGLVYHLSSFTCC